MSILYVLALEMTCEFKSSSYKYLLQAHVRAFLPTKTARKLFKSFRNSPIEKYVNVDELIRRIFRRCGRQFRKGLLIVNRIRPLAAYKTSITKVCRCQRVKVFTRLVIKISKHETYLRWVHLNDEKLILTAIRRMYEVVCIFS